MATLESETVQQEFAHLSTLFFNSAYFGPSPARAKTLALKALEREMDPSGYPYRAWVDLTEEMRTLLAQVIGCPADEVAHSTSVSEIISHVVNGITYQPGDAIVVMEGDYPSNILPWMINEEHLGFTLHRQKPADFTDIGQLIQNLPPQTRLVDLSLVRFDTGTCLDIVGLGRELKKRGILFLVDASQCLGSRGIRKEELEVIDILACVSYKWMLGPYGHAFARFSPNALDQIRRTHASWLSSPNSKEVGSLVKYTTESLPGARRFDRGQAPNMLPMALLKGSLQLFLEIGLKQIEEHNMALVRHFLDIVPSGNVEVCEPSGQSSIVCLKLKNMESALLEERLRQERIDASVREGNLRLSFHMFNTTEQVETLARALGG